jgi:hypothetical protein
MLQRRTEALEDQIACFMSTPAPATLVREYRLLLIQARTLNWRKRQHS